jgi:hypothetical protein
MVAEGILNPGNHTEFTALILLKIKGVFEMTFEKGEKVHIIVRRQFENDVRRHFIGTVIDSTDFTMRVEGYVFVLNLSDNQFEKRPEKRVRIISLVDANNLINVIPRHIEIEALEYLTSDNNRLVLTDKKDYSLDINEFSGIR